MSGKPPPFDGVRAAFYLVAGVIAFQCLVILAGVGACLYYSEQLMQQKTQCQAREIMAELLSQAMAAALAFSAGFLRGNRPPDDKE